MMQAFNTNKTKSNFLLDNRSHLRTIFTYKHDKTSNTWSQVEIKNPPLIKEKLSFITYNVWFEPHNWDYRIKELTNIFIKYSPDFICLQEMTNDFLQYLSSQKFIQDTYYLSGNFKGSYDVLMLSKYPVKFFVLDFNSKMGRNLLISEAEIVSKENSVESVFISTAHFESLNNSELRKIQLKASFDILNSSQIAFLMGDFNFDSSWTIEEENIDNKFLDCWVVHKELRKLDDYQGYTMGAYGKFPPWRPDRILIKDSSKILILDQFQIIGKDPIDLNITQSYNNVNTPSDHYGLYSSFTIINENRYSSINLKNLGI